MATNFYFHALKVKNFRSFKNIELKKLKRINIIGGFNGVGKTALLEILFFLLDRRNPVAIVKPLMFRRILTQSPIDPAQFLFDSEETTACIEWSMTSQSSKMTLSYQLKPDDIDIPVASSTLHGDFAAQFATDSAFSNQKGFLISVHENKADRVTERQFCLAAGTGVTGIVQKTGEAQLPLAEFVSVSTKSDSKQLAQTISTLIKQRKLAEVVQYMRLLHPELATLSPLQEGEEAQVYAHLSDERMMPVQYMGDGFQNLLNTICAIVRCSNGVVLLDEIDSAIHYSVVKDVWKIIAQAAASENVQIFATTHSRECILSAANGIATAGREKDFQYIRLEKGADHHSYVAYSMDDLANAERFDIEIR